MQAPPSSTSRNINKTRIDQLFVRMGVIYGHLWQGQFKQVDFLMVAKREWAETLIHFADKEIQEAINECKRRIEFPPTLPSFYQLCLFFKKQSERRNHHNISEKKEEEELTEAERLKNMNKWLPIIREKIKGIIIQ